MKIFKKVVKKVEKMNNLRNYGNLRYTCQCNMLKYYADESELGQKKFQQAKAHYQFANEMIGWINNSGYYD